MLHDNITLTVNVIFISCFLSFEHFGQKSELYTRSFWGPLRLYSHTMCNLLNRIDFWEVLTLLQDSWVITVLKLLHTMCNIQLTLFFKHTLFVFPLLTRVNECLGVSVWSMDISCVVTTSRYQHSVWVPASHRRNLTGGEFSPDLKKFFLFFFIFFVCR